MSRFSGRRAIGIILLLGLLVQDVAHAQTITQVQKLDFGKWFFGDNSSQVVITVTPMGVVNYSGPINMFRTPKPGIYNVTGLPPFTTFNTVTVTMTQPMTLGGKSFTLDNFTTQLPDADGAGATQLRIGGEAKSSGDGQAYGAGSFEGQINIELDY